MVREKRILYYIFRGLRLFCLLSLPIFGGVQFYHSPGVIPVALLAGLVIVPVAVIIGVRSGFVVGPFFVPGLIILSGMIFSALFNYSPAALGRIIIGFMALSVMLIFNTDEDDLGWIGADWLVIMGGLWAFDIPWENSNIIGTWGAIFALPLVGLRWWFAYPVVASLIFLEARGALLLFMTGLFVLWSVRARWYFLACFLGVSVIVVLGWRVNTILHRFSYWLDGLLVAMAHPFVGVGPGGLQALGLVSEPGTNMTQIHAHNLIISTAANTGLVGLACLAAAVLWVLFSYKSWAIERWRTAIFMGLLAHSMVDEPLFWPGLLFFVAILGNVNNEYLAD